MFTAGNVEVAAEGIVSDDIRLSFVKMNHDLKRQRIAAGDGNG
jgi:hypothetical protein